MLAPSQIDRLQGLRLSSPTRTSDALVAVDLEVMAVEHHIALGDAPTQVLAAVSRPVVYALTPGTGSVHEIQVYRLSAARKVTVASSAVSMRLSPDERSLYVLAREPRALISISLDSFRMEWHLPLPEEPVDFAVATAEGDGVSKFSRAAVSSARGVWLVDLGARQRERSSAGGRFRRGAVSLRRKDFARGQPGRAVAVSVRRRQRPPVDSPAGLTASRQSVFQSGPWPIVRHRRRDGRRGDRVSLSLARDRRDGAGGTRAGSHGDFPFDAVRGQPAIGRRQHFEYRPSPMAK